MTDKNKLKQSFVLDMTEKEFSAYLAKIAERTAQEKTQAVTTATATAQQRKPSRKVNLIKSYARTVWYHGNYDFSDTYYNMGDCTQWQVCYGKVYLVDNSKLAKLYRWRETYHKYQELFPPKKGRKGYHIAVTAIDGTDVTATAIEYVKQYTYYCVMGAIKNKNRIVTSENADMFWRTLLQDCKAYGRKQAINDYYLSRSSNIKQGSRIKRSKGSKTEIVNGKKIAIPVPVTETVVLTDAMNELVSENSENEPIIKMNAEDLHGEAILSAWENLLTVQSFDGLYSIRNHIFSAINHYIFEQVRHEKQLTMDIPMDDDDDDSDTIADTYGEECKQLSTIDFDDIVDCAVAYARTFFRRDKSDTLIRCCVQYYFYGNDYFLQSDIANSCHVTQKTVSKTISSLSGIFSTEDAKSYFRSLIYGTGQLNG